MPLKENIDMSASAEILYQLIVLIRNTPCIETKKWAASVLDKSIRQLEHYVVPEVSIKAAEKAYNLGLENLSIFNWHDQTSKMFDRGRKIFHWEHIFTVAEAKQRLLDSSTQTVKDVLEIIKNIDVAWILKEEDKILTRMGYRHKRNNPWEAYANAGIEIFKLSK